MLTNVHRQVFQMLLNAFHNTEKEERTHHTFLERKHDITMKTFERQFNNKEKITTDSYEYLHIPKKAKQSKYMFVSIDVKQEFLKF